MKRILPLVALVATACTTPPPLPGTMPALKTSLPLQKVWTYADAAETERVRARLPLAVTACCAYWIDGTGRVVAFDQEGRTLWRADTDGLAASGVGTGPEALYLGTREGEVLALNPADGRVRWRARVSSEVISAPAGSKDVVVVHVGDGKVLGLAADDGRTIWSYESKVPLLSLRGASVPVISGDAVLVGLASGQLVSLKLWDGTENWQIELASSRGRSELDRMVDADATPRLHGDAVYGAAFHGRVAAVDARSGRAAWSRELSTSRGMALDDENIYVTDNDGVVWSIAQSSGTILWKQDALAGRGTTGPAYFAGTVVVGDRGGYLHWLDKTTGQFLHRTYVEYAPFDHAPIVFGDVLYTATRGGAVDAYRLRDMAPHTP